LALYRGAQMLRVRGKVMLAAGVGVDAYTLAMNPTLLEASRIGGGWSGAYIGAKLLGAGGAYGGTAVLPGWGTAVGGFTGAAVGGGIGYWGGAEAAQSIYDWLGQ
jgi:hypothetical protein